MKNVFVACLFLLTVLVLCLTGVFAGESKKDAQPVMSVHEFTMMDIDGNEVNLADFKGKILLIVNVASKCGMTPQYEGLQSLYEKYKDDGLVVLGFPANNFLSQEPGSNATIKEFCSTKYQITFPMFEKISVIGHDIHPLYRYLTDKKANHNFGGNISWNFNKFLIDRDGHIIDRFGSRAKPDDEKVVAAIEAALKAK